MQVADRGQPEELFAWQPSERSGAHDEVVAGHALAAEHDGARAVGGKAVDHDGSGSAVRLDVDGGIARP